MAGGNKGPPLQMHVLISSPKTNKLHHRLASPDCCTVSPQQTKVWNWKLHSPPWWNTFHIWVCPSMVGANPPNPSSDRCTKPCRDKQLATSFSLTRLLHCVLSASQSVELKALYPSLIDHFRSPNLHLYWWSRCTQPKSWSVPYWHNIIKVWPKYLPILWCGHNMYRIWDKVWAYPVSVTCWPIYAHILRICFRTIFA